MAKSKAWHRTVFKCERCEHVWLPREETDYPNVCPKCKSPYWDKPRKIMKIKG